MKTTPSIVDKLQRESIRLSQMQDIAGCRIVVDNIVKQEEFVETLKNAFPGASIIDRRDNPSYGYRAVHVIVEISGRLIEIQVRSSLQHLWARLSEKSSDVLDPAIKYGGGPKEWQEFLLHCSERVATYEKFEESHYEQLAAMETLMTTLEQLKELLAKLLEHDLPDPKIQEIQDKLQNSTREVECLERDRDKSKKELVHMWSENILFLQGQIDFLDDLEK